MRHQQVSRRFSRTPSHRQAMFKNLANAIIQHEIIKTTLPRAKDLRRVVEPLITLAKEDTVAHRRLAFSRLRDAQNVAKLFSELGPRFNQRPGGYLRILKCGYRKGDKAPMAMVLLTEQSDEVTEIV